MKKDVPFPQAEEEERALDRRRFLYAASFAAFMATAGQFAGRRWEIGGDAPPSVALRDPLAPGESRAVTAEDGRDVLVVRLTEGDVVAFDRRCPHLGCPVVWSSERSCFECPCHHAAFEAHTGKVLYGPPRRGLDAATVLVARDDAGEKRGGLA